MVWLFKRHKPCNETLDSKAAFFQARLDKNVAKQKYLEITKQADHLEQINQCKQALSNLGATGYPQEEFAAVVAEVGQRE